MYVVVVNIKWIHHIFMKYLIQKGNIIFYCFLIIYIRQKIKNVAKLKAYICTEGLNPETSSHAWVVAQC